MKKMITICLLIIIALIYVECSSPKVPNLPLGCDYTITEDILDKGLNRQTVRVKITKEVSESVIKELSEWIKDNRPDAKSMIIFYYVENGKYIGNAWVRVDFDPEYKYDLIAVSSE